MLMHELRRQLDEPTYMALLTEMTPRGYQLCMGLAQDCEKCIMSTGVQPVYAATNLHSVRSKTRSDA